MICPKCGGKIRVADLVHNKNENATYRRRECTECGHKFYTTESEIEKTSEFWRDWSVHHRDSSKE